MLPESRRPARGRRAADPRRPLHPSHPDSSLDARHRARRDCRYRCALRRQGSPSHQVNSASSPSPRRALEAAFATARWGPGNADRRRALGTHRNSLRQPDVGRARLARAVARFHEAFPATPPSPGRVAAAARPGQVISTCEAASECGRAPARALRVERYASRSTAGVVAGRGHPLLDRTRHPRMSATDPTRRGNAALGERISALSAATLRIGSSLDLDTVLDEIADSARALTGARCPAFADRSLTRPSAQPPGDATMFDKRIDLVRFPLPSPRRARWGSRPSV